MRTTGYLLASCLICNMMAIPTPAAEIELFGDQHIDTRVEWRDNHYKIHGNLIFDPGGTLYAENCTIELMCTYSKEFTYQWKGGTLITENVTIGGTLRDGAINQCVFEQNAIVWHSTDTTVRYTYGILVDAGEFRALRLKQGANPDALHVTGTADVRIEDSEYDIVLRLSPGEKAAKTTLDLPVKKPVTHVYDQSTVPGIKYRLEMVNSTVPNWWFVFFIGLTMDGPPLEVTLNDCPSVIPAAGGYNLQGRVHFPVEWKPTGPEGNFEPIRIGNLTVNTTKERQMYWSLYAAGEGTDLTILGPTQMPELILWGSKTLFLGEEGTFNAQSNATVIDVGHPGHDTKAELTIRNATITAWGNDLLDYGDYIRAQITAQGAGKIYIENAKLSPLRLVTKEKGTITLKNVIKEGDVELVENGGPIEFLPEHQ